MSLRVGCQVCGCLRAFVGYDVLYWTRVARPGDQIDRILNPSQSPIFFGNGTLSGPAHPAPTQSRTDLFTKGFRPGWSSGSEHFPPARARGSRPRGPGRGGTARATLASGPTPA